METEEITKLVDGIYKNILDKFNPGARQMINAGKAYLKALHGAAAASRIYVEAITKLARQSQQGTWGGSSDIGSALMQIVEVYKEIQAQQMNILKAFYVDLLVPLETNLEKDTKVVQSEQKRFLQQHKQRSETYSKAAATMKKQRKKQKNSSKTGIAMDKELKSMQILEEERSKLDAFCEQSLKNAMTQERRRYGFVLERHCSLAKHYLAYHSAGNSLFQTHLDNWQEVAKSREYLPNSVEGMFANKLSQISFWAENSGNGLDMDGKLEDDRVSLASQLRKTKSVDVSCLDVRAMGDLASPGQHRPLARAKSDFNLTASTNSLTHEISSPDRRPKSMAVPDTSTWDTPLARALYAYLSSGENQLSFLEGDVIALMGERNKGWQFGENLRTQSSGWFPLAYTEPFIDDTATSASSPTHRRGTAVDDATTPSGGGPGGSGGGFDTPCPRAPPTMRFGDTLALRNHASQLQEGSAGGMVGIRTGPPTGPAPTIPSKNGGGVKGVVQRNPPGPPNASLHSSNDSGFSNDPPPAPEVDYSDDEHNRETLVRNKRRPRDADTLRSWVDDDWNDNKSTMVRQHSTNREESRIERVQKQLKALELPYEKKVKRTKSLWKLRRGDDVIEGMAMWRHRSLIDLNRSGGNSPLSDKKRREDDAGIETESCIVVADHRVSREATLLPRTRLLKKAAHSTMDMPGSRLSHAQPQWYNSWDEIKG
ncbi:brain-specific angiogenesis inhibitor 1-associated protein 2 isoform X2 [Cimex lectularius]|uniref:Insulin receptor tyrosine kinase substrate n=1 Tax=Cimex lectularius TaxID=79782 RepID=A0A8I6S5A2_CIMLE|nr:brain-specific angiogenesis inhibitor 1-associated protein 2 isoform X2 [Cimex lectularius]